MQRFLSPERSGADSDNGWGNDDSWKNAQNNIDKYYKGVSAKISAGFGTHFGPISAARHLL